MKKHVPYDETCEKFSLESMRKERSDMCYLKLARFQNKICHGWALYVDVRSTSRSDCSTVKCANGYKGSSRTGGQFRELKWRN